MPALDNAETNYSDRVIDCPLCESTRGKSFLRTADFGGGVGKDFSFIRCLECGGFWLENPLPPNRLHEAYSESSYYSFNEAVELRNDWRQQALAARYAGGGRNVLRSLATLLQAYPLTNVPGSVLDVGCGSGQRLMRLVNSGWTGAGIEPNPLAVDTARRSGLDVRVGTAEDLPFSDGSFDAVIMAHSIEHCHKPRTALSEARRILKPKGQLIVTTPNTRSVARVVFGPYWLHWDAPRHLVLFHRRSLLGVLRAFGFKPIRVRGSSTGGGWVDSALNALRNHGYHVPLRGQGLTTLRKVLAFVSLMTNRIPWSDEMEVIAVKETGWQ